MRRALEDGRVDLVAQWLGRPYTLVAANSYLSQQRTCGTSEWPSRQAPLHGCVLALISIAAGACAAALHPCSQPSTACRCRVQLCDFENQPPGVGRYDAKMSPAEVPTSTCQIGMDDHAAVIVQVSNDGNVELQLHQSASWPEWALSQHTLLLTFK